MALARTTAFEGPLALPAGFNGETLSGNKTLTIADGNFVRFDPGGANRDVILPAEEGTYGMFIFVANAADATENLVCKDDAGNTIGTVAQNQTGLLVSTGTAWALWQLFTTTTTI